MVTVRVEGPWSNGVTGIPLLFLWLFFMRHTALGFLHAYLLLLRCLSSLPCYSPYVLPVAATSVTNSVLIRAKDLVSVRESQWCLMLSLNLFLGTILSPTKCWSLKPFFLWTKRHSKHSIQWNKQMVSVHCAHVWWRLIYQWPKLNLAQNYMKE